MSDHNELPIPLATLLDLFEWLEDKDCDCTLGHTETFLNDLVYRHSIDIEQGHSLITWLHQHGGHCDCEVLWNIADKLVTVRTKPPTHC